MIMAALKLYLVIGAGYVAFSMFMDPKDEFETWPEYALSILTTALVWPYQLIKALRDPGPGDRID